MHQKNNYFTANKACLLLTIFLLDSCGAVTNPPHLPQIITVPEEMKTKNTVANTHIKDTQLPALIPSSLSKTTAHTAAYSIPLLVKNGNAQKINDQADKVYEAEKFCLSVNIPKNLCKKNQKELQDISTVSGNNPFYIHLSIKELYEEIKKNNIQATEEVIKRAKHRDTEALHVLGYMHYHGLGVEKNPHQAVRCYKKAAKQGHAPAQTALGHMYCLGEGVAATPLQGINWYKEAAKQKHIPALNSLGNVYYDGIGVKRNVATAIYWHTQVKQQPSPLSNYFKFIQIDGLRNNLSLQKGEEIKNLQAKLLKKWQKKYVKELPPISAMKGTLYEQSYLELNKIMAVFTKWINDLNIKVGLLIDNVTFKNTSDAIDINTHQQKIGIMPYVKEHETNGHKYISFGEESVQIAEEIIQEISSKNRYKEAIKIFDELIRIDQTSSDEVCPKEYYLKKKINLSEISAELETNKKPNTLTEKKSIFDKYYDLFVKLVASTENRNEDFRRENNHLFE